MFTVGFSLHRSAAMPSFVLNVPGPGAYNPQSMQGEMRATQYELWKPERHAVSATLAETRQSYERAAAETQKKVDVDNRERAEMMRMPTLSV